MSTLFNGYSLQVFSIYWNVNQDLLLPKLVNVYQCHHLEKKL